MLSVNTRQAYAEIDNFIELLDEYNKNKIPKKLREFFKKEKDETYKKDINPNIAIKDQNLKEETLALIAILNLKYWCEDEEEKQRLKKIYAENEERYQQKLREKYNSNNIFKKKQQTTENEKIENYNNNLPAEIKKEKLYQKIIRFLKKFFNRF